MHIVRWIAITCCLAANSGAQTTVKVNLSSQGAQADELSGVGTVSADGRYVAFFSDATNLVPGDVPFTRDVFHRDRWDGVTTLVSVSASGGYANGGGENPTMSADGRFVAFASTSTDLLAGPDANGAIQDVFVRDVVAGTTAVVSVTSAGVQGNADSDFPVISANGRFVAFVSLATNLLPGPDANAANDGDLFVHDRLTGATELVSRSTSGAQGNDDSFVDAISSDGRFVTFGSAATNLLPGPDANGLFPDAFLRDRLAGTTECVSVSSTGVQSNRTSNPGGVSDDGRFVAFESDANNLGPDDNGFFIGDVYVRDRLSGTTELVSRSDAGVQGDATSDAIGLSSDGRFVVLGSWATNLVPGDTNGKNDVFVRDQLTKTMEMVSVSWGGAPGNDHSNMGRTPISADGRYVVFNSMATNLTAEQDMNSLASDGYVRDRGAPAVVSGCLGDGSGASCPCSNSGQPGRGCENSSATGGAVLSSAGESSLSADTWTLTASGEKPTALSVFLQGPQLVAPTAYGDGLRCVGGPLKRLYVKNAVAGVVTAPGSGDPPVAARSAQLGAAIPIGATRHYQTYYRDAVELFCPLPAGKTWNVTQALSAVWSP